MVEIRNMVEARPFISQIHRNTIPCIQEFTIHIYFEFLSHSGEDLKSTYTKNFIDTYKSSPQ